MYYKRHCSRLLTQALPFRKMDLSILIIWTNLFLVLGLSGECFPFYCLTIETPASKQCVPDLTLCSSESVGSAVLTKLHQKFFLSKKVCVCMCVCVCVCVLLFSAYFCIVYQLNLNCFTRNYTFNYRLLIC